ncbi:MAG: hypothetical protein C0407_01280 [Desulfobacca sp.]|nr:hypothetical protein [Desulfobacca sp.]
MKKKGSKEKNDYPAILNPFPEKENPLLEIIRLLTEASEGFVYIRDGKGNILYGSPGILNLTGYTPEEWKTDPISPTTNHPLNKLASGYSPKTLQTGQKLPSYQLEIYHKDGHPILLEINETPFTQSGQIAGIIGIARDISERKKILKFVEKFQSFLQANPLPLVIYNLQGLVSYLNPAFEKTFGWHQDELVGKQIPFVPEEERQPTLEHIQKVLEGEEPPSFETKRLTKTGDLLEIDLTAFRYNDEPGNPSGIVVMLRDVTKRRSLEREIQRRSLFEENLIESTMDGILAVDRQGGVILFNQGAARIFGYTPDKAIGKIHATQLYPEVVAREVKKAMWSSDFGGIGKLIDYETEIITKNGEKVPITLSGSILFDGKEEIGSVGYFHDLTSRKQIEKALKRETVIREEIVDANPIPTIVLDRDHRVVFWNRACVELTGYTQEEMVGSKDVWKPFYDAPQPILADLIIDGDLTQLSHFFGEKNLRASLLMKGAFEAEDYNENLKGESRYLYFLAAPIYDTQGELWGAIESIQDLTERKALEAKLSELATVDGLTGVYNRRYLERKLEEEAAKAKRYNEYLALILLDIDQFKEINDHYGHLVGDQVLKKTAETIRSCMRTIDSVARYGGDEFVVLLPRTNPDQMLQVMERLDYALDNLSFWDQEEKTNRRFTVSYGAFSNNKNYSQILRQADKNMYKNKQGQ